MIKALYLQASLAPPPSECPDQVRDLSGGQLMCASDKRGQKYSTVQYSTVKYSTVLYSTVSSDRRGQKYPGSDREGRAAGTRIQGRHGDRDRVCTAHITINSLHMRKLN